MGNRRRHGVRLRGGVWDGSGEEKEEKKTDQYPEAALCSSEADRPRNSNHSRQKLRADTADQEHKTERVIEMRCGQGKKGNIINSFLLTDKGKNAIKINKYINGEEVNM